jgi:drug/metabolite transporter (DMT)-like permease
MIAPTVFVIVLFALNGFKLSVTPFSLALALVNVFILISCSLCSIKALAKGSLANYSLYLMSGGMILPVVYGFTLGGDTFSIWKTVSIVVILAAIFVKYDAKEKMDKKTLLLLVALFMLNGLVGVVSSVYQGDLLPFERPAARDFQILYTLFSMLAAGILYAVEAVRRKEVRQNFKRYLKASPWALLEGALNGTGNLLLLISLSVLEPSLQYPIITGGSIFLAAVFGFFFKEKPTVRGWISIALAVVGTVFMMF